MLLLPSTWLRLCVGLKEVVGHSIVACKFQRGRQTRRTLCLRAFTLQCQKSLSKEKNSFWKVRKHHHRTGLGHWAFSVQEHHSILNEVSTFTLSLFVNYLCHVKQVLKTCLTLRPTISVDTMTAFSSPSIFLFPRRQYKKLAFICFMSDTSLT